MMLLVFTLDDRQCALDVSVVERVYRAIAVTPLPSAPGIVLGIINIRGRVLPVIDVRQRFGLPQKTLTPSDRLIIAQTSARPVALIADSVSGVVAYSGASVTPADTIVPGLEHLAGVVRSGDGLILIHDLQRFLSLEEEAILERALQSR